MGPRTTHLFVLHSLFIHLFLSSPRFFFLNCKFWIQSSVEGDADDFPILVTLWLAAIKQQEQIWLETCPNPHLPVCTKGKKVRCAADINMSNLGNLNIKHMSKIIKCTSTCLIEMSFIPGAPACFNVHGQILWSWRPHQSLAYPVTTAQCFRWVLVKS